MIEIFKSYFVTEDGRVFSSKSGKLKERKPVLDSMGYLSLTLRLEGKTTKHYVHRLVASAYCHKPEGCNVVNHKDGNKLNNHKDNVEWTTDLGNQLHAWEFGLNKHKGSNHTSAKLSDADVRAIRSAHAEGVKQATLCEAYGLSKATMHQIVKFKTYKDVR